MEIEIICSLCGLKNTQNTSFCDNCGQSFNFDFNPSAPNFESISENFEEDKYHDFNAPPIQFSENYNMQSITFDIMGTSDSLPPTNYLIIDPQDEHIKNHKNTIPSNQKGGSSKPTTEILVEGKIIFYLEFLKTFIFYNLFSS